MEATNPAGIKGLMMGKLLQSGCGGLTVLIAVIVIIGILSPSKTNKESATPTTRQSQTEMGTPQPKVTPIPDVADIDLDVAWQAGDWPAVIASLEFALKKDPTDAELRDKLYAARVNYGRDLLGKGDKIGAATQLRAAATLVPDRTEARALLISLTPTPIPTATPVYSLALISSNCLISYGFDTCKGFVKNITDKPLRNVWVVIAWYDSQGVAQTSDDGVVDYDPILPGQQSPWTVMGRDNPALRQYTVSFKHFLGGTIPTRDDRKK